MINRKLCIGMFILGGLSHYDNEEIVKHPHIQYIAKTLKKKHFSLKNGSESNRLL